MKLIIIHGPPAVGKLTIGSEIARLTGFKLFHNHISIDYVKSVIDFGTPAFWRAVGNVRFGLIAEAAKENIDLIHTFCYEFGADDEHFAGLISSAEDYGGEVHLVLLNCSDEARRIRISNESRVRIGKLVDPESVGRNNIDLTSPYPGRETLILDTTIASATETAERIIEHFGLQRQTGA
ncbi:MAG TPA: AAA family ATPase [Pyrinomonadaceae bacterium]|nr:AAA family ATPase [Pyrinomonadaceae bacterium]